MKSKELILLTNGFPYGKGEQFLETEIELLAHYFDKIYLFPISREENERSVPDNVEIIMFGRGATFSPKKMMLSNLVVVLKVFLSVLPKRKLYKISGYKKHFNNLLGYLNDAKNFKTMLEDKKLEGVKIYSYWFGPWGDILTLTNAMSKNKVKFITRVHGYDYDINRTANKLLPFRDFQMKHVNAIYPVSKFGVKRIQSEYPKFKGLKLEHLGVNDNGENFINESNEICIVSCSSLIPLKRVHLIAEILSHSEKKIKWVHFGDGPMRDEILDRVKSLPSNIEVDFKGLVENSEILNYYKHNSVDLFINVSEFEGIPVSIMEAISFGIPVVGCDVCGVPEIVNDQTGLLLEKEFELIVAHKSIFDFLEMDKMEMNVFRKQVKDFWFNNFNADKNYTKFIEENLM